MSPLVQSSAFAPHQHEMIEETPCQIFLFGDISIEFEEDLRQLLHVKQNECLKEFFEQVNYALRVEIAKLPTSQRGFFPKFTTLIDLASRYKEAEGNPALVLSLFCTTQVARFINYYGTGSRLYPAASNSYIISLCAGSFAAAAISTSQTLSELLPAAIEAVLTAFRAGLCSMNMRRNIDIEALDANPSWSLVVGMDAESASVNLDSFSATNGYARNYQPYLSAVTTSGITISGPPKALDELAQTPPFSSSRPARLSINAPYHASHLYQSLDIEAILSQADSNILNSYKSRIPLISSATGMTISKSSYSQLLGFILHDTLVEQLRWDSVLKKCGEEVTRGVSFSDCNIFPILTNSAQSLASVLSQTTDMDISISTAISNDRHKPHTQRQTGKFAESKIAIVGYSGRFPDAASNEKFWDLLHEGLDVHRKIPKDRFDVEAHYDPTGKRKNTSKVQYGCFIEEPGLFDGRFFNMSPRECENTDPAQRLAITTAFEALEMSGFVTNRTASTQQDRVGVFYGVTSDDWREVNSGQNIDTYFVPGGCRAFVPGRINYYFKFCGPSFSIDTACSSSSAAIQTACTSLWRGECDTAIAGGANVLTNPDNFAGLDRGHFLSATGNCNTFDDNANGYCRADGVGTVILKRLEDAEADNDPIHGVILGAFTSHSGRADSITRPHEGDQASVFNKLLRTSNVSPLDISYIEMHGTGTQAGDATEMASVLQVFAPRPRGSQYPLHIGSAKANVGHAESASGITSLIKLLMMMKHSEIPPHCGIKTKINHNFPTDLTARNVNIAFTPTPWTRPNGQNGKRTAFLNNFSAAGGNTALLIEDAPVATMGENYHDARSTHLVSVSAKSIYSLQKAIEALVAFIDATPDLSLPALSYTSTARRMHHNHRVIASGNSIASIRSAMLISAPCAEVKPIPAAAKLPTLAFVFTGQSTSYLNAGKALYETFTLFRADIQQFDRLAQGEGFSSFLPLIHGTAIDTDGLGPVITQVGTVCIQMAIARLWISWGIVPRAVIGHSLGEFAALHIAGVISASDAIFMVATRAQLLVQMCSAGTHAMLAVKGSVDAVRRQITGTGCEIACINQPNGTVISGSIEEVTRLSHKMRVEGLESVKLDVPFAFHSAQVDAILGDFEKRIRGVTFNKPSIPFISPLLKRVVIDDDTLGALYLSRACREVVNFQGGLEAARNAGFVSSETIWIEIGSHPVCSGMIKATLGPQTPSFPSLRQNVDEFKVLTGTLKSLYLAGIDIEWGEYQRDFKGSHQVLGLPSYKWETKNYWIQYRNNFCLTKGDDMTPKVLDVTNPVSAFSTPSVQRIVEQTLGTNRSSLTIESDIHDPCLAGVLQGHKVNGVALCPSSLYADIALTIGDYLMRESSMSEMGLGIDVSSMTVEKPLIAAERGPQLLRASAAADWGAFAIDIKFYSVTTEGNKIADHASCTVKLSRSDDWLLEWKRNTYLILSRTEALQRGVDEGESHKIKRGMVYKLFGALVDYGPAYQGMQEVILDSKKLEATSLVSFQAPSDGSFLSPYWIDSLGHIAGFVMNGNDGVDSKAQVFINHGWDRMRCATKFSPDKTYRSYIKMQSVGGNAFAGDTYILDGDDIVGVFEGVTFKGVPRSILDNLLPAGRGSKPQARPSIPSASKLGPGAIMQNNSASEVAPVHSASISMSISDNGRSIASQILAIVGDEAGIPVSDLGPRSIFADLGIDSLLSLTIISRIREELELEVPSTLFSDNLTVKALMETFSSRRDSSTAPSTPEKYTSSEATSSDVRTDYTPTPDDDDIMSTIRLVLAEEIGVEIEELTRFLVLSELGMDSLLALTVMAKLRELLCIELPLDLFVQNGTLDEVESALGVMRKSESMTPTTFSVSVPSFTPQATSVLLQGMPKLATKTLFLFPDGSGSSTSYALLPQISPNIAVYGLNCPYMKTPENMKCSIEELCSIYLEEVRRRQPHGTYHFGGWSAGGICAYEAAQQVTKCGKTVEVLVLIDSPNPVGIENPPMRLYDFFNSIGVIGSSGKEAPEWLRRHFTAFMAALDRYNAVPFSATSVPKTAIIWAADGVCKHPDDPRPVMTDNDPKEMRWLLNNRTDTGSNGWINLLSGDKMTIKMMDGVNHFTMLAGEKANELSDFMRKAMLQ